MWLVVVAVYSQKLMLVIRAITIAVISLAKKLQRTLLLLEASSKIKYSVKQLTVIKSSYY